MLRAEIEDKNMSELKAMNGTDTWIVQLPVSEGGTGQSTASVLARGGWGCNEGEYLTSKGTCENPLPISNDGIDANPSVGIAVLILVMVLSVIIGFAFGLLVGRNA